MADTPPAAEPAKPPAEPAAKTAAPKKAHPYYQKFKPGEINITSMSGGVNKHIVVATLGLVTIGVVKKWNSPDGSLTPILVGGYVFMLVLAVMDMLGASKLASSLAMLALVTGLITDFPWNVIFQATGVKA